MNMSEIVAHPRERRAIMPIARERLRCMPPGEMYGNRAPVPPYLYQGPGYVRTAPPYGLNWGLVRENPNHIGHIRHVTPELAEKIRLAVEAEER